MLDLYFIRNVCFLWVLSKLEKKNAMCCFCCPQVAQKF